MKWTGSAQAPNRSGLCSSTRRTCGVESVILNPNPITCARLQRVFAKSLLLLLLTTAVFQTVRLKFYVWYPRPLVTINELVDYHELLVH